MLRLTGPSWGKCDVGLGRKSPDVGRDDEEIPSSHGNSSGDQIPSTHPQRNLLLRRRLYLALP